MVGNSMCEFKYCDSEKGCFLNQSSPCPGKCKSAGKHGLVQAAASAANLKYDGFLDRDFMIEALGLDDTGSRRERLAEILYVVPRSKHHPGDAREAACG